MAAGDIWEIIIRGVCASQAILNVLHFRDVIGDADLDDWASHFEDTGVQPPLTEMLGLLCDDYHVQEYLMTKVFPLPRGPQISHVSDQTAGVQGSAEALPTSLVIKWVTAVGGRSGRGRSYLGPLSSAQGEDGVIAGTTVTQAGDYVARMLEVFNPAGALYDGHWTFVIWSPTLSVANNVTGGIPRNLFKTQRRRQIGVGM